MVEIRTPSKKKRYHVLRNEAKSATAAADVSIFYHGYRNVIQQVTLLLYSTLSKKESRYISYMICIMYYICMS
jgi:hypothetical protein